MTKEQKQAKREARHELMRRLKPYAVRSLGMFATNRQLKAAVKTALNRFHSQVHN